MLENSFRKKLYRKAFYTSPLMAVPSLSPVLLRYEMSLEFFLEAFVVQSVVVFCIWSVNIGLLSVSFGNVSEKQTVFWRYFLSYAFALLIFFTLREILLSGVRNNFFPKIDKTEPYVPSKLPYGVLVLSFSINSVILIIADLIAIREKKAQSDLENSQLKLKNAEIINQELKQQIHPHFLFNALNTLKTLIHRKPDLAEEYLIRLSNFLRISISATKMNTVRLVDELNLCEDYLEMQKTRFGNTLQYCINVPNERIQSGYVPIFSIQLLIENVIKHNAMYKTAPLCIDIVYEESDRLKIINNIQERETKESSTGLGLDNLAERYRILSGDHIIIHKDEESFSVSIKILDHESNYHRG